MAELTTRQPVMRPLIEEQTAGRTDVEFVIESDAGELTSGQKRQRLLQRSRGEYIAFVDDDDTVSPRYVDALVDACDGLADVVTFRLEQFRHNELFESWRFGLHDDAGAEGRMAANHLCAWRRAVASRVSWCPDLGYGDDQLWTGAVHLAGIAWRERFVPEVLYRYQWSRDGTANQTSPRVRFALDYFGSGLGVFRDQAGGIWIESGAARVGGEYVMVYDSNARRKMVRAELLTCLGQVVLR